MNIRDLNDYKTHTMNQKDFLMFIRNITPLGFNSDEQKIEDISQLFYDAVDDIYDSINIIDEDLINDSILHLTQLVRDTKDKNEFNVYTDIDKLTDILSYFLNFDFSTKLYESAIEMIAFISSTNLLEKTKLMLDENFFRYIVDSAMINNNPNSFIILSNFILEDEENFRKCFLLFPPKFIADTFYNSNDEDYSFSFEYNNIDFQSQKEVYLFSVLSLLSSYCNYDVDETEAADIFLCIKDLIIFNENNSILLNELFYSLSMLRQNCKICIQKANEVNLFESFVQIKYELSPEILVTIFQYYGESILSNYQIPKLNIEKLINNIESNDRLVSGAAMWLIWIILSNIQDIQCDLFQSFYTPQFFTLLQSIISLNEMLANVKLAVLIISTLIENATSDQIILCVSDELINCIFDCNCIESDDNDVVFHIFLALNQLNNHFYALGNYSFFDFLKSKLVDITICDLTEEELQTLTTSCPQIMEILS